jgi:hypothetical protein
MKKRRTAEEVARLLRDVDRDLAKGLTVSDACRKIGIGETTYYCRRQRHDPAAVDADRRCCEFEAEVERLKRLVAERRPWTRRVGGSTHGSRGSDAASSRVSRTTSGPGPICAISFGKRRGANQGADIARDTLP